MLMSVLGLLDITAVAKGGSQALLKGSQTQESRYSHHPTYSIPKSAV